MSRSPRLEIEYCTQCRWLLRAAWTAEELLTTFVDDLKEVALVPARAASSRSASTMRRSGPVHVRAASPSSPSSSRSSATASRPVAASATAIPTSSHAPNRPPKGPAHEPDDGPGLCRSRDRPRGVPAAVAFAVSLFGEDGGSRWALVFLPALGAALVVTGLRVRRRAPLRAGLYVAVGVVPSILMFWMVAPPLVAIAVAVYALLAGRSHVRGRPAAN